MTPHPWDRVAAYPALYVHRKELAETRWFLDLACGDLPHALDALVLREVDGRLTARLLLRGSIPYRAAVRGWA